MLEKDNFKKATMAFEKADAELTLAKIAMIDFYGNRAVAEMGKVYGEMARESLGIKEVKRKLDDSYLFVKRLESE